MNDHERRVMREVATSLELTEEQVMCRAVRLLGTIHGLMWKTGVLGRDRPIPKVDEEDEEVTA